MSTITSFLNSYQSDFSYINLLSAADLTAAGSAYAMPAEISTTQISVASFGATGNGSDQTSQIQAALNAGSGKTVYFPPGTYVVSSTLTIPANTRLLGDNVLQNTVIKASSSLPAGSPLFTSSGNITYIQKIVIDGNNNPNRTEGLLFFYNVRYVYLIQSIIQNTSHMGMAAGGCLDVRVWGCKFENCGRPTYSSSIGSTPAFWSDTLNGVVARDVYLEKNLFLNNNWSAAYLMPTGGYFKDNLLVNNKESGIYSNQNANFVVYENNYIYGQRRQNISASGIEIDGGYNLTIRNNIIHNCGNDGISLQNSNGSTIENNTCYDNGAEYTYAAFGTASGIMLYSTNSAGTYNCIIRYNKCYNTTGTQRYGIYLYRSGGPTINNCTITNNNNYSNAVGQISNNASAVGGTTTISNNYTDSARTTEGIYSSSSTIQNIFNTSLKTFSITASPTTGEPNTVITYTINTTLIPNGIKLYLQETGSATATDFQWTSNEVVINNNTGTITRTIGNISSAKTSTLSLREGSTSGIQRASTSVNLNALVKTYRIVPFSSVIGESKSITFSVYTTGVISGTVLYYSIEGTVSAADFSDNTLTGTVTIGATGIGYFTKTLIYDSAYDNNESIVAKLFSDSSRSVQVASTSNYIIRTKDQNATYNLSASGGVFDEQNKTITFTLTTQNIPPGSTVPYQITGVSSADFSGSPSLTGNFTITKPSVGKSNYNELGGWVFYPSKPINGDITDVFIRGNRVVVSEEIWWSGVTIGGVWTPTGPSGIASSGNSLKRVSDKYKNEGYVTGLSITPYCLTHRYRADLGSIEYNVPAVTFEYLMSEIAQSEVSFVQLNPHLFTKSDPLSNYNGSLYWTEAKLLEILNNFKTRVKALGKEFYVVIQGWKQTGQTFTEVNNYNNSLLSLTNVDEFYVFGQEDGLDLADTQSLNNDLTETLSTSISFTTVPDSTTEGIETLTMTLTGQAVDKENTLLPFLASDVVTASVSILDSSTTPTPTYTLTRSISTINEGQSVTITLTTSNVANGTSIPWTVTGISAGDLSSGSLTGNFVVGSVNTASFTLSNDTLTEGAETLNFALDNGQASITVVVNDTSTTPVPTYTLTNDATSNRINEGQTVVFTLATTNVSAGTSIPWTVTGISAGDLSSGSLTGNFIVGTTDTASFTLSNDLTVEGTERLTLTLNGKTVSSYVDVIDTSTAPGAPTYALTNNVTSPISEGTVITFTLTTTNVSSGTLVPWEIRGTGANPTDSADFTSAITGNFVINAAGVGTVSITVNNDIKTENSETFRFRLTNNVAIYNDITITDTSFPTLTYSLTSDKSSANEDESVTFYLEQTPYSSADSIQSYSVSGITSADLDTSFSAVLNGNFNLVNVGGVGKDSKTFKLNTDSLTEGAETLTLTLTGINRSESVSVTINDTSITPGVSYSLSSTAVADTINEGDSVTFHLGTTGVGSGATLAYTVTGINAADLSSGTLTGNFTTNVNGGSSVTFTLANDLKLEGTETLTLALNNGGASKSVTVQDTSFPTYTLSGAPAVSEGSSITITLTTTGLGNGDLVPYNISGINAADIDSASVNGLTGNFIINPTGSTPNVGTITITLANDLSTEGPETFYVNLNNGLAAPHAVTITDSSVTPPATPSYSLSASDYDVNEGDTVIFTLVTTNVTAGTNVPYTITGLNAADLTSGSISGNFVVGNSAPNEDQITIVVKADNFTEGVETLRLRITGTSEYVDVVVRDTSLTPTPTLPTYALTANSAVLREGESVVIVLSVTNLGVGVSVPYVISGISSADIDKPLSGGSFVINAAGKASVTLNAAADLTSEGTETLRLTIYGTANYIDIPIADVSTGFPTYSLSANSSTYNEGDTVVIILTTTSLPTGTSIPYTIVGVGPTDINGASLTGNFTTNAAGYANVVLTLTNDGILEGPEFLNVSLNGRSEFVTVYITDTSRPAESFRLSSSATVVSEGSTVNVTLITTGIVQGTVVPYTLSGTLDATDYSNLSSGTFIINEYGNSTISLLVNKDFEIEGTETFIVTLTDRPQTNITILVNDFSYQVTVPSSFTEVIPLPAPPLPPPPGFGITGIDSLGDALDKPSSLVQKLLPEFARGG